ncbi:TIGR04282 family arsenosugar biosynthesis glycosyltransferase [Denitromonas iodatirespirans]|uniref:TIGR04282 family arsenosugar biosynthesis glycosyltransferase n=1 Tax=Denitromonas iodatirespirans TaxID=2795389 RepID=UPI001E44657B|nr:TIGR04282 family arsenosugar biosynthesis glycosyltransferase [Denitromonas iodatirespirans]
MNPEPIQIALFAKAPVAGQAKTRLIPTLGPAGAARLHRQLVRQAVRTACAADLGPVSLWCAPGIGHRFFRALAATAALPLHPQHGDDLGARMAHAFATLTPQGLVLLIGSDCPMLTPTLLHDCAAALRHGDDAVFLPAEDGGYALVGLRQPQPALFAAIPWGSDTVMAHTRERLHLHGLRWSEPATVWDVDRPDDLARLHDLDLQAR